MLTILKKNKTKKGGVICNAQKHVQVFLAKIKIKFILLQILITKTF